MPNQILLKQSSVANSAPTTSDLAFGELAVNTYDGKVFFKVNPGTGNVIAQVGTQEAEYVWYVSKSGNDANNGKSLSTAFLTIKAAVTAANVVTAASPNNRVTIFVKAGDYTENNPISLNARVTIVGDDLRSVSVRPLNPTQDIFWVRNGCYLTGMTFRGHLAPAAAVAFPATGTPVNNIITTSPYVQNCSSITFSSGATAAGAGMKIDGSLAGGLKSMVLDAYTQINSGTPGDPGAELLGGIGVHIINQGYAQLVSLFTVCCSHSILCESGGTCSVTNSNSSFGTFALYADGKSPVLYTGDTDGSQTGPSFLLKNLTQRPSVNDAISFDGGTTLYTIYGSTPLVGGASTVLLPVELTTAIPDSTAVNFYARSQITSSSHTFEYVGTGDDLSKALPNTGAQPIQANEVVAINGGEVIYTSTDQKGNFRVGDQLTINSVLGTIEGEAFDKSLFAVMTPYILALEG
jgi:hypothetical protein